MAKKKNKAPQRGNRTPAGAHKKFPYELTIGMIVKNDVKNFKTCMETMMILRNAIPCQLVIADTGSDDGTREIAMEYADEFFDYTWCDDFSAARNAGIEKAKGRWFLYIDSDHEFDKSILGIVDFLKSEESYQYQRASVTIRNYEGADDDRNAYYDSQSLLMVNFGKGHRLFENRIHESVPYQAEDITYPLLEVMVHHWGMLRSKLDGKLERNEALLKKSVAEDPHNLQQRTQLIIGGSSERVKINFAKEALADNEKESPENLFPILTLWGWNALTLKDWDNYDEAVARMEKNLPLTGILAMEYLCIKIHGSYDRKVYEEIPTWFQRYDRLFEEERKNPNLVLNATCPFKASMERIYYLMEYYYLDALEKLGKGEEAAKLILESQAPAYQMSAHNHSFASHYFNLAKKLGVYSYVGDIYHMLYDVGSHNICKEMEREIEALYFGEKALPKEVQNIISQSLCHEVVNQYTALHTLRLGNYAPHLYTESLLEVLYEGKFGDANPVLAELIYGFIVTGEDGAGYLARHHITHLLGMLKILLSARGDLTQEIEALYAKEDLVVDSLKLQKFIASLGLEACLWLCRDIETADVPRVKALFTQANALHKQYVETMYNPAIITEESRGLVAKDELFSFFVQEAMDSGDRSAMEQALTHCEYYADIVKTLLREETHSEMNTLGQQVKSTIKTLLQGGDKVQAKMLLERYKTIVPNDPEIPLLMGQV